MYKALDVARYILWYTTEQGSPISNLRLQKLLYFAWIAYFKRYQEHLYEDMICAWRFGPVVPSVYYEYSLYAALPIAVYDKPECADSLRELKELLKEYLQLTTKALVDKTHEPGKPWALVYKNGAGNRSCISFSLIRDLECAIDR